MADKAGKTRPIRSFAACLIAGLATVFCSAQVSAADGRDLGVTEKDVRIPAREFHEECFDRLGKGDRLIYRFDAARMLDFNVHYHVGRKALYPVNKKQVKRASGAYLVASTQGYCLMWSNRSAEAVLLHYRFQIRPRVK